MFKRKVVIHGVSKDSKRLKFMMDEIFEVVAFLDRNKSIVDTEFDSVPIYTDLSIISDLDFEYIFVMAVDFCGISVEYHKKYNIPFNKMLSMLHVHQINKQKSFLAYANEIYRNKIPGSIAEVGVDYGDTAKYLNLYFPNRTLYLFDTFSGFDSRHIEFERKNNTIPVAVEKFYHLRSCEYDVLERMFYPNNVIIKPGHFPESLNGLEDKFALVHIDCDLQKPILCALEYFFPRLSAGGLIIVHDYYSEKFTGVRSVVREFSDRNNFSFLVNVWNNSAVFCK